MPRTHPDTNITVPGPDDKTAVGGYTGFNALDLHQIYKVEKLPAYRSQIATCHGKPAIARLPDGDLLATGFFNHEHEPEYRYPDGSPARTGAWWTIEEASLMRSADEGRTWSEPRLLGIPGRPTQLSCLRDGALVMATISKLFRSTDGGETWAPCEMSWESFVGPDRNERGFGETNGVAQLSDGSLICSCFAHRAPVKTVLDWGSYVLRSVDAGRSWADATFVVNTDEVSYLPLPDGRLLGFVRVDTMYARDIWGITDQLGEGGDTMAIMESPDLGRTWTEPRRIGLGMAQVPGFPLLLPDGRLLLLYGNRRFPFGCQAIASRDLGATWDLEHPLILSWFSWDNYCGHPRSVLLPDGSILTGYYTRVLKEHASVAADLASHALRWRAPDRWPPMP